MIHSLCELPSGVAATTADRGTAACDAADNGSERAVLAHEACRQLCVHAFCLLPDYWIPGAAASAAAVLPAAGTGGRGQRLMGERRAKEQTDSRLQVHFAALQAEADMQEVAQRRPHTSH